MTLKMLKEDDTYYSIIGINYRIFWHPTEVIKFTLELGYCLKKQPLKDGRTRREEGREMMKNLVEGGKGCGTAGDW